MKEISKQQEGGNISRVDWVYDEVKSRILNNVFPPGFQALEPEVAKLLGVSRTPVREALIRLEKEGLIELVPRRGMRVVPLVPDDMREIYQLLTCLEAMAAELAAKKELKPKDLKPMEDAVLAMEHALLEDDLDAWAKADENFHRSLLEMCGNRRLTTIALNVWDQVHRARLITLRLRPKPTQSSKEHQMVLEAIRKGDAELARDTHYQHRIRSQITLMEILEKYKLPQL
ncbi:GntR family transcriptional regulator [Agarilytica rhodophyticola]|uniref:GntR family transcriptional regulator n=1 Tax=Agarilytica rhodophyticola TaxID=1737490 RepID=UPI000B34493D|nr:GntR family transcriptional regulator [Agarilytica rhodophyticola]